MTFQKGQVVFDKLNKAYVQVRYIHHTQNEKGKIIRTSYQVYWINEKEIASYHLMPSHIRHLT